jgi:hypothetical protein
MRRERRQGAVRLLGAALCGLVMLSGCATISVATDFDRRVNFSQYQTFQIVGGHLMHNGIPDDTNTLVKNRIVAALRANLQAKGLHEVTSDPDLYVGYYGGARTRTEVEGMGAYGPFPGYGPFWVGGWWYPTYSDWWTQTYHEGTLIIDLVDARSRQLVWRAYAQARIDVPVSEQKIRDAVDKVFAHYPPGK